MKRRQLLQAGMATGAAISTLDWLRWFRSFGVPGTAKTLGIADAVAQTAVPEPRFLIYWFLEGGWDGYCMFNPADTSNDATRVIPSGTLHPNPSWSAHRYRPKGYGVDPVFRPKTLGNITYGHLAQDGTSLFPDLAVVSSHYGNTFHSGGRFEYHYGKYSHSLAGKREANERSVMQAFCEKYGQPFVLPHVSWHRWLSDGELSLASYPEGTGYYEKLGPAWAHTIYGKTPSDLRARLQAMSNLTANARDTRIRSFVDDLHTNFVSDKNGPTVAAFASAVQIHKAAVAGGGVAISPSQLFNDATLRAEFNVTSSDEFTDSTVVNGNPARSKETPQANVQAMMTWELMRAGLSCGFFIESRDIRGFDTHRSRQYIMSNQGQSDQLSRMRRDLWSPLKALVARLKNTQYGTSGKSYWDLTTIVLGSEMGRTIQGDVGSILSGSDSDSAKYAKIMDQDCCQHWKVSSTAFLGGAVQGNRQWGRVGSVTLDAIPTLPTGALDPAFDPVTGQLISGRTKSSTSYVSNAGHVYATALSLTGISPTGIGKNTAPAMAFIKKP